MPEFTPSLFSTKATCGRRTFFFDIKNTKDQKPYLLITQSSIKGEEKQRVYLNVFESELSDFKNALEQTFGFLNGKTN